MTSSNTWGGNPERLVDNTCELESEGTCIPPQVTEHKFWMYWT